MDLDIDALMHSANWWENVGYAGSAAVVVGIVIESYDLYHHWRAGSLREKRLEFLGFLIVIFGLAAEVLASVQSNNRTGLIIAWLNDKARTSDVRVAQANEVAQKAAKDAAEIGVSVGNLHEFVAAQEDRNRAAIGELKQSAAELNQAHDEAVAAAQGTKKTLADMSDLLEKQKTLQQRITAAIAPRTITDAQARAIVARISPFPNTYAAILLANAGREAGGMSTTISQLLTDASWIPSSGVWTGIGDASGVVVLVAPDADKRVKAAAAALAEALAGAGIVTTDNSLWPGKWEALAGMQGGPSGPAAPLIPIRIVIGAKPQG